MAWTSDVERAARPGRWRLSLFGFWQLRRYGQPVDVGGNAQRLLALLALRGTQDRSYVAGLLWPEHTEPHAHGNLRATLSRLRRRSVDVLAVAGPALALGPDVAVDVHEFLAAASSVLGPAGSAWNGALSGLRADELLPGWYDDWVLLERERLRQLRLHALEAVAEQYLARGQPAAALDAALCAVTIEPLRESAHRAVIEIHLAEGNRAEANRQLRYLTQLLRDELGATPSRLVRDLFR
jgi:DNA-binding SARP family transcriptional activator